jgi:HTH-type transcriptional regulator, glycine betaine synthesis regulator
MTDTPYSSPSRRESEYRRHVRGRIRRSVNRLVRSPTGSDVAAFETAVVSYFVSAADLLGVPKSVAIVYGICFASAKPLSFSDIRERVKISQGSISQGLRILREIGALEAVDCDTSEFHPNVRATRDYYIPNLEMRKLIGRFVEDRMENQLRHGAAQLREIGCMIPHDNAGEEAELRGRIKSLVTWHDKGRALMPIVRAFLKLA